MVRRTLWIIGILWALVLLFVAYVYLTRNVAQYMDTVPQESSLTIRSSAFDDGGSIPPQYTCDEKQVSPPLMIAGVPADAKSLALIVEDRDVPKELVPDGTFVHWVVFNMQPSVKDIGVGEIPGMLGNNGADAPGYIGPCPPKEYEPAEHRYYFDLYALDATLDLEEGASAAQVRDAMQQHVLAKATLTGRYKKQ